MSVFTSEEAVCVVESFPRGRDNLVDGKKGMPKRSCPFGDSAPLQLKTRVRMRELSQGVMGEKYRREIFERTKQLLFRGAQAYMDNKRDGSATGACRIAQYQAPQAGRPETCSQYSCNGQMLIGQDGKLRQPRPRETATAEGMSKPCSTCVRTVDGKEACTQCDRPICKDCSKLCSCCNAVACSLCSVIESDYVCEQILCSGCSTFND